MELAEEWEDERVERRRRRRRRQEMHGSIKEKYGPNIYREKEREE